MTPMADRSSGFRDLFAAPLGRETIRAFVVFSLLMASLVAIGGELAFRDLSLSVLRERLDLGRAEALGIAGEIAEMGRIGDVIDYALLRGSQDRLRELILEHMAPRAFIRHVEVRDRFGVRLIFVPRPGVGRGTRTPRGWLPVDWPADREIIRVPLDIGGTRTEGQVLLGISQGALQEELRDLRGSLRGKIVVAAVLALGVLVLGLLYVLHLIRKNRHLEQARQSAARASYVGLLAAGLAHEIRNPLNAMNMNLQMLEEELGLQPEIDASEHAELLDSTKQEIKRLERLVNNFLTYARPARPRFKSRDLNVTVGEVIRLLEADFRQYQVELQTDLEPLMPRVETDETQFKQALINLLVNARQVQEGGGTVTVRTRIGTKGEAILEVEDTGPGIEPDARDRIFDVFYSSRGGGTGLGLPIARRIVERHGGTIELDSVIGRGTTFRIRLPRHHRRAAVDDAEVDE